MSDETARVIIFDTTLRDGEQAPGFSMDVAAKIAHGARPRRARRRRHRGGLPHRLARRRRRRAADRARRAAPDHRGARALPAAGHRGGGARARSRPHRPRIHVFLATSDLHLERKLRMTREDCLDAVVDGVRLARRSTDDVEFSAEDATRSDPDFLCRVVDAVIREGCTHGQPARHGRLRDAGRDARLLRRDPRARRQRRPGDLQRALPRRPRPRRRQQPRRHPGRRAPGGVHDQRHRRARRQRRARGDRDGARACAASACRTTPPSAPRGCSTPASCSRS